ncbi:ribose 5-phosphate isomerase B [Mangrovivirga sp. M17]|uniref:Ribose 5-phosphate isomerase B n=1 Tax=Mangrovivirga halotolerans TaxID=2993936 RepID=A0ABT3RT44_9BACT|nr:ribose 5-phosphate isomerase B [Mangrovivirga halotolerans]MCX2744753.1 ribose 5-phosphate isomerase B [Mangrovivirga halotolerans]
MKTNKLFIGGDHAGFELKQKFVDYLNDKGFEVTDHGTYSEDSTDYPDYAHPVADDVAKNDDSLGILICGSGNGVCMTANKHKDIRAALCWNEELAALARQHNNANVICIPSRFVEEEVAFKMLSTFLNTDFEGGRHERRVGKISC